MLKMVAVIPAKDHPKPDNDDDHRTDVTPGNIDVEEFFSQEKAADQDQYHAAGVAKVMLEAHKQTQHNEQHGPGKKPVRKEIAQVI